MLAGVIAITLLATACEKATGRMFHRNRVTPIVKGLSSPIPSEREQAEKALSDLEKAGLSEAEGLCCLRAASQPFPPGIHEWDDASASLISAAGRQPRASYAELIDKSYPNLSPRAQEAGLRVLSTIETRQAAEAFVNCLRRTSDRVSPAEFRGLEESPRHTGVFYPSVLDLLSRPNLRWPVLHLTLCYLKRELLSGPEITEKICYTVGQLQRDLHPALLAHQKSGSNSWLWADDYQEMRSLASLTLDVLGHVPTSCAWPHLRRALDYEDPRLLQFAVLGVLRSGRDVASQTIARVAASAECRNWLFRGLREMGREALFPRAFRTQEAFAESEMVNWLIFPTELGRAPDEIELKAVVPRLTPHGEAEYYIFRFRTLAPHWAAKDGWLAGGAGPFLKKDGPTTEAGGDTFSTFTPWSNKTPEEHAREFAGLMDRWRESWERER